MPELAASVQKVPHSRIRELAEVAMSMDGVLRLYFGESNLPTPEYIKQAAVRALSDGYTFYIATPGSFTIWPNLRKLPWTFRPLAAVVSVHPGEMAQVVYEVENRTERPMTGQAIPSYGPQSAAEYFKKLDCFCFAKQSFGPHERRQMPVVFVVDPKLPRDINTISLSYTFFEVEGN